MGRGNIISISPLVRAIMVIGVIAAMVSGITFAALQSQATLTGNTISSVSTDLVVNNQLAGDETFSDSEEGFAFTGLVPGEASDPENFQLRNQGDSPIDVSVQVTGEAPLPSGVTGTDIEFTFAPVDTTGICGEAETYDWATITNSPQMLVDDFANNAAASCDYTVTVMIKDTVTTEEVDISAFNFVFSGTPSVTTDDEL